MSIRKIAAHVLATDSATVDEAKALAGYVLGDADPSRTAGAFTMTKWTAIKDEPIPAGNSPVWVTDGARIALVKRKDQAFTEGETWIVAEPGADGLSLVPSVTEPTHWTMDLEPPAEAVKEAKERAKAEEKRQKEEGDTSPPRR